MDGVVSIDRVSLTESRQVIVRRIGEPVQTDVDVMSMLQRVGATPGSVVTLRKAPAGVLVGSSGETAELDAAVASHVFVATIT